MTDDLTAAVARLEYAAAFGWKPARGDVSTVLSALEAAQAERDALRECVKAADELRDKGLRDATCRAYDAARAKVKP